MGLNKPGKKVKTAGVLKAECQSLMHNGKEASSQEKMIHPCRLFRLANMDNKLSDYQYI